MINNTLKQIILPIIIALVFASGLWIGSQLSSTTENRFIPIAVNRFNKIADIINYIESDYVDSVRKEQLVDETIQYMLQQLDPHSYYISAAELAAMNEPLEGNFDGIGVQFSIQQDTIVVITPVVGGPSEKIGVLAGDRIVKVDGKLVAGVGIRNADVMKMLRGESGTKVNVEVSRSATEKLIAFDITRDKIPLYSIDVSYLSAPEVGYIKLSRFSKTTKEEFKSATATLLEQGMKKLILDLRGNGGGYMDAAIAMADEFLADGKLIVYTQGRNRKREDYYATAKGDLHETAVVVLIDEGSASASEILAGAIQDNDRGVIIGRKSFGKGLVQEQQTWPDGSATRLTIARYYTPTGRSIQQQYESQAFGIHRFEQEADSSGIDSVKQQFTTPKGKLVYGGGGITPDIVIAPDTTLGSWYLSLLLYEGVFYEFAFQYADKHREKLNAYGTAQNFENQFSISKALLEEFIAFGEEKGVKKVDSDFNRSKIYIINRLKASIGQNIYGSEAYYPPMLALDSAYLKATTSLQGVD